MVDVDVIKDHEIEEGEYCSFVNTLRDEKETVKDVKHLDLSHLQPSQAEELPNLVFNHRFRFGSRPKKFSVSSHGISLVEDFKTKFSTSYHVHRNHQAEICHDLILPSVSCHGNMSSPHNVICDWKDNGELLKLSKSRIVKSEVRIISHVVESETRLPVSDKELLVHNKQTPHRKKFFSRFLAILSFVMYMYFIFVNSSFPSMTNWMKNQSSYLNEITPNDFQIEAVLNLEEKLCSFLVVRTVNFNMSFYLCVLVVSSDVSDNAAVTQVWQGGREQILVFCYYVWQKSQGIRRAEGWKVGSVVENKTKSRTVIFNTVKRYRDKSLCYIIKLNFNRSKQLSSKTFPVGHSIQYVTVHPLNSILIISLTIHCMCVVNR